MKQTEGVKSYPAHTWVEATYEALHNGFFIRDIVLKGETRAQRSTITQKERNRRTAKKRAARKARRKNKK